MLPPDQHVPAIIDQNNAMFQRSPAALDGVLSEVDYLVENRFSVTDIIVGYTLNFAEGQGLLSQCPNLCAYMERLYAREHCTLVRHGD